MTWKNMLTGDPLPWLISSDSPELHPLVRRELLDQAEDDPAYKQALRLAHQQGPITAVLDNMHPEGYWELPGPGYNPKYRSTVWAVILLAQLGARASKDDRVDKACRYVLDHSLTSGGQFSASGSPSGTADCLQGNLCWALSVLGITDPRLELAFDWMARTVTGEGIAPIRDRQAPARYYAGKCGPTFACGSNNKLPCAWGAAKVMLAFSVLPESRRSPVITRAIQQGVDFLFSVDPATAAWPCGWSSKPSQNWWKFGFPVFYVTDLLQVAEALAALGWGKDERLKNTVRIIIDKQDKDGRWALEYDYAGKTWGDFGIKKQANKWVTLRALRVLKMIAS